MLMFTEPTSALPAPPAPALVGGDFSGDVCDLIKKIKNYK
jgi:hypothetical protein